MAGQSILVLIVTNNLFQAYWQDVKVCHPIAVMSLMMVIAEVKLREPILRVQRGAKSWKLGVRPALTACRTEHWQALFIVLNSSTLVPVAINVIVLEGYLWASKLLVWPQQRTVYQHVIARAKIVDAWPTRKEAKAVSLTADLLVLKRRTTKAIEASIVEACCVTMYCLWARYIRT